MSELPGVETVPLFDDPAARVTRPITGSRNERAALAAGVERMWPTIPIGRDEYAQLLGERDAYAAAYTWTVAFLDHRIDQQVEVNAEYVLAQMREQRAAMLRAHGIELPHESSPPAR